MSPQVAAAEAEEFSLALGGPLYQFFVRVGLLRPALDRVKRRMLVVSMAAWAPLLVLTVFEGRFLSGVEIPFLRDFEVHVRLLLALPLLILGELPIHVRIRQIVSQFEKRQIVLAATKTRFTQIVESAIRLRNSWAVELILFVGVFVGGGFLWRETTGLQSDTWYSTAVASGAERSLAGFWYQIVSVRIFQFVLLRWYFRLFVWSRLLWQIAELDLNLIPTHPDRRCGLGFLDGMLPALGPFLLAQSSLLAGSLGNRLIYEGAKLPAYGGEIGALAVFLALITLGPLCVFTPKLLRARVLGLHTYGRLASDYVIGFDRKWIGGQRPPDEPLVGTGDIQSLADLANSFAVVQSIIPFPFGRSSLAVLAATIVLPMLPLLLTMYPLQELLTRLFKLVM